VVEYIRWYTRMQPVLVLLTWLDVVNFADVVNDVGQATTQCVRCFLHCRNYFHAPAWVWLSVASVISSVCPLVHVLKENWLELSTVSTLIIVHDRP